MRKQGKIWLMIIGLLLASMLTATAFAATTEVDVANMDELFEAARDKGVTRINLLFEADFAEVAEVLKSNPGLTIDPNGYGMYIDGELLLQSGLSVTLRGRASDGIGVLKFTDGTKIKLEKIDNFSLLYTGAELCTEGHASAAECAAEDYQCCENMLLVGDGEFTIESAKSYDGHFDVSITYLDGKTVELTDLSKVTYDKLRGAVQLAIQYVEPEYVAPKTTSITGKLVWDDSDNTFELRPKRVTIDLYRNGKKTSESKKVSSGKFTFSNLLVEDSNGKKYTYTVRMRDSLKPVYTTKNNDKTRTITNTLNWLSLDVYHVDADTNENIAVENYQVPYGLGIGFTAMPFEDGSYQLQEGQTAEVVVEEMTEDMTYTFFYDRYVEVTVKYLYYGAELKSTKAVDSHTGGDGTEIRPDGGTIRAGGSYSATFPSTLIYNGQTINYAGTRVMQGNDKIFDTNGSDNKTVCLESVLYSITVIVTYN